MGSRELDSIFLEFNLNHLRYIKLPPSFYKIQDLLKIRKWHI